MDVPGSALPTPPTRFIGRSKEREELARLLRNQRMLTLVGLGGSGKTRLAIEVAREATAVPETKPAFVDLSAIRDAGAIRSDVALQIGVVTKPEESLSDALIRTLNAGPVLLVLDNCEQVVEGCRDLIGTLLQSCPRLKVLATSREPLRIAGEVVWQLAPLATPPTSAGSDELASYESVELFEDRATTPARGSGLGAKDIAAVADLCRRLDGLPLAIELAAAWVPVLGVAGIQKRLSSRLDLLADSPNAPAARHRSLRVVLEHSEALLPAQERILWRRLAIFAPRFDLEAAEVVCSDAAVPVNKVPRFLRSLIERSLIQVINDDRQGARYRLLETVREYGLERLAAGGELEGVASAHARYYVGLAEEAWQHRDSPDLVEWATRMTAEHANVREALEWLRNHDHEAELQLAGAMAWVWGARELLPEGRRLLEQAREGSTSSSWFAGRAHRAAGVLALEAGDPAAAGQRLQEALQIFDALQDEAGQAFCLARLGMLERSFTQAERRALLERAVELGQRSGERPSLVVAKANLGALELERGAGKAARQRFEEAVELCRQIEHARWLPQTLEGLAQAHLAEGNPLQAESSILEGVGLAERAGLVALLPSLLETVAEVAAACERSERALRFAGAAAGLRQKNAAALPHGWPDRLEAAVKKARRARPGSAEAVWKEGTQMDAAHAIALALSPPDEFDRSSAAKPISRRQAEVAALVATGLTNAQIAARLSISERTAEWHLEELRNRLGFSSRSQVAAWAVREGLGAQENPGRARAH
jgi:predicted ATPase/DNA-binding CsgD family transcriptional regulator